MEAASEHLAAFERFERWAVRSARSDLRWQGQLALRETLFAPLRNNHAVAWAEVHWEPDQVLSYREPIPDEQLQLLPIEGAALGRLLVASCAACRPEAQAGDCVVIERPPKQRPARVRVAFCSLARTSELDAPPSSAPQRPRKPRAQTLTQSHRKASAHAAATTATHTAQ